jgi:phosphoribosylamine--glycine ligase
LVTRLFAAPGNPGIAQIAQCLSAPQGIPGYADLAEAHRIDLTVVGPEGPLVAGIVDEFRRRGLKIVGPSQAAARLEGSKLFAKAFFARAGIPTARTWPQLTDSNYPLVVKADALAAGKGVVIAQNPQEARRAIDRLGPNVLLEEFLEGEEVSFIGLCNGTTVTPFPPTQDHKRLLDGDQGPNTGGMGAYVDRRLLSQREIDIIMERIMLPAIEQMRKEGTPFTGFLYAGLMMTAAGPKILEFNVRLGDPETQALLHNFSGDLALALLETCEGGPPKLESDIQSCSVCVVLAAAGYPENVRIGDAITGIADAEAMGATVFHAGTKQEGSKLLTSGGRVLGVTTKAPTLPEAVANAYRAVDKIHFDGMQYRRDIGAHGLIRW